MQMTEIIKAVAGFMKSRNISAGSPYWISEINGHVLTIWVNDRGQETKYLVDMGGQTYLKIFED